MKSLVTTLVVATLLAGATRAQTQMEKPFVHPLFTDNMVLQRGIADPVWGWAKPGEKITVSLNGSRATATATAGADGKWLAKIGPFKAGGPFTLTVTGAQTVTLRNVMVGDVWICSGQSNMEMGIGAIRATDDIAKANNPNIRLFTVPKTVATAPRELTTGNWDICTPETVTKGGWGGFSAVGYFFGKNLQETQKVPIGLIHTSWGGTIAEAWTSAEALKANLPEFVGPVEQVEAAAKNPSAPPSGNPNVTTVLYNGMIAPLVPFGIKGAIWYQGESNAGRGKQYQTLLPTMIKDWRTRFGVGEFPFFIVQLANFMQARPEPTESAWAELREAQALTSQTLPKTGLALAIDIGDATDIHPLNKQEVGRRLALNAQAIAYRERVEYSGPIYKSLKVEDGKLRLSFTHDKGLATKDGTKLLGFAIAGADNKWVWADAVIEGKSVVLSSPLVPAPVAARYDWADNPNGNLINGAQLPAVPFRTDKAH